ncbi:hypothetical protein D3227_36740 [Mesorhizobium waimense]|uniref:Uncharacterized protein n=1 Tax=Mesorhizobium waimense TaxID=1300307 RepID=A0A3A5JWT4_9HYPH|nr:hypothetical protein D3227_36740 [Mesorhizobium waimense]
MSGLSRFERPVVVQVSARSSERIVVDVNDAAAILLRGLQRQTLKRKVAMDADSDEAAPLFRHDCAPWG